MGIRRFRCQVGVIEYGMLDWLSVSRCWRLLSDGLENVFDFFKGRFLQFTICKVRVRRWDTLGMNISTLPFCAVSHTFIFSSTCSFISSILSSSLSSSSSRFTIHSTRSCTALILTSTSCLISASRAFQAWQTSASRLLTASMISSSRFVIAFATSSSRFCINTRNSSSLRVTACFTASSIVRCVCVTWVCCNRAISASFSARTCFTFCS